MDPGFSGTKFFWVQVFQCPDFSGSESSFQILCLGPGFTNSYIYFFLQQHFSLFFHFRDQRCLFLFEWCLIYTQNFKRNNYIMYGFWGISEIGKTWKSKSWSVKNHKKILNIELPIVWNHNYYLFKVAKYWTLYKYVGDSKMRPASCVPFKCQPSNVWVAEY